MGYASYEDATIYGQPWNFNFDPNIFHPVYDQEDPFLYAYEDDGKSVYEVFKQFTTILDDEEFHEQVPIYDVPTFGPDSEFLWDDQMLSYLYLSDPVFTTSNAEFYSAELEYQTSELPIAPVESTTVTLPETPEIETAYTQPTLPPANETVPKKKTKRTRRKQTSRRKVKPLDRRSRLTWDHDLENENSEIPRPHICENEGCSKSFVRKFDLKRHFRIHSGEEPYRCDTCGATFRRVEARERHSRRGECSFINL
ncbi:hypothetical protein SCHPADRAFT_641844 [Schizopora paradoxa]|uniref:C2H2-type domain-containing protein n=1 Tax=Schizopora paradoxa TaxID=27342 RepID=A0A0H2RRY7_9AGAM|nr:hypothetical protein SCHPADRAFT_641844 [Schizopora paradoxa]